MTPGCEVCAPFGGHGFVFEISGRVDGWVPGVGQPSDAGRWMVRACRCVAGVESAALTGDGGFAIERPPTDDPLYRSWTEAERRVRYLRRSGIPKMYWPSTLEDWLPVDDIGRMHSGRSGARQMVRGWLRDEMPLADGLGVYLHGVSGVGKTWLAAICAQAYILRTGRSVLWLNVNMPGGLLDRLKATFDDGSAESEGDVWRAVTTAGMVVLDDADKGPEQRGYNWRAEQVYRIVAQREEARAQLVVTANSDPKAFAWYAEHAITTRLLGRCLVVMVPGTSMRGLQRRVA